MHQGSQVGADQLAGGPVLEDRARVKAALDVLARDPLPTDAGSQEGQIQRRRRAVPPNVLIFCSLMSAARLLLCRHTPNSHLSSHSHPSGDAGVHQSARRGTTRREDPKCDRTKKGFLSKLRGALSSLVRGHGREEGPVIDPSVGPLDAAGSGSRRCHLARVGDESDADAAVAAPVISASRSGAAHAGCAQH